MTKRPSGKLNQLERRLPPGLIVDASWLEELGYSSSLRSQYVSAGWLEQSPRRVYRRSSGLPLTWEYAVISLQSVLQLDLIIGGRTALELGGYAHYLPQTQKEVHLYGPKPPPTWLHELKLDVRFRYHNSARLFQNFPSSSELVRLKRTFMTKNGASAETPSGIALLNLGGPHEWPFAASTAERAILELLDELPKRESFHQVDMLMEGLTTLSPSRLQKLLVACRSVKVKRLFFFYADRHRHAWLKRLDKSAVDLGSGKRKLVDGGKLDPTYQITVPEDLDGVR